MIIRDRIITTKDIMNVTDKKIRYAQKVVKEVKAKHGLPKSSYILTSMVAKHLKMDQKKLHGLLDQIKEDLKKRRR